MKNSSKTSVGGSPAASRARAASLTTLNGMPDLRATSSRDFDPSDWFRTHSSASSSCAGLRPPMDPYSPRIGISN